MRAVFLDFDTLGPGDIDITPLTAELPELECFPATAAEDVRARIADADVIIVNKVRLNAATLRAAGNLQLICLAATGTDNIDLTAARELDITVCNIRDYCTPSVIQHVFALILALTQHLREYDGLIDSGAWAGRAEFCLLDFPIRELDDKTMGIVGLGNLGKGRRRGRGSIRHADHRRTSSRTVRGQTLNVPI